MGGSVEKIYNRMCGLEMLWKRNINTVTRIITMSIIRSISVNNNAPLDDNRTVRCRMTADDGVGGKTLPIFHRCGMRTIIAIKLAK